MLIQHSTGSLSHSEYTRKRNKRHPNWKGGSKTVIIHRWYDIVHRRPWRIHQTTTRLLDLMNEFGKIPGYKINIQKSIALVHTDDELSKRETKKKNLI